MQQTKTPKSVRQLTLTDVLTDLELDTLAQNGTFINVNYRCGSKKCSSNEWLPPREFEDCSRADIARSYRLGRGF
jgi:hypothetical protein